MQKLKVCFIGIGSIAKRHIKNLKAICSKRSIELHMDAYRHSFGNLAWFEGIENVYHDIAQLPDTYDIIFITNPTELHLTTLKHFHDKGKHFFFFITIILHRHI